MKVKISATWLRLPWQMPVWDTAYGWLVKAGAGEARAKQEIENIKLAAQAGQPQAVRVKANFDAVALLVLKGLPKPSVFVAQRRRQSPLVPGSGARGVPAARGAAAQLAAMKRQQIERAQKERAHKQVQARFAEEKAKAEAEAQGYEAELEMLHRQLERRDLADEVRAKLEAQAERYEALIEKIKTPEAADEATSTSEAMAAEQPEATRDDAAEAIDSGASGDVEFNNAGT